MRKAQKVSSIDGKSPCALTTQSFFPAQCNIPVHSIMFSSCMFLFPLFAEWMLLALSIVPHCRLRPRYSREWEFGRRLKTFASSLFLFVTLFAFPPTHNHLTKITAILCCVFVQVRVKQNQLLRCIYCHHLSASLTSYSSLITVSLLLAA